MENFIILPTLFIAFGGLIANEIIKKHFNNYKEKKFNNKEPIKTGKSVAGTFYFSPPFPIEKDEAENDSYLLLVIKRHNIFLIVWWICVSALMVACAL